MLARLYIVCCKIKVSSLTCSRNHKFYWISLRKDNWMQKVCPRCSADFDCREDSVLECDCVHVILSPQQIEFLAENYNGCLCVECLREIQQDFEPVIPLSNISKFKE